MFFKIGVLKNFANFTGKHLLESLFEKVASLKACNFIKKRLQHRCQVFPVKFTNFLRTPSPASVSTRIAGKFLFSGHYSCFVQKLNSMGKIY